MDIILTDTAKSKCFRYLNQGTIKQCINDKRWESTSDGLYRVRAKTADGQTVIILFNYYEDEDKVVVITQKANYHQNE